jgi:hypothetical protein
MPEMSISATDAATNTNEAHLIAEFNRLKNAGTVGFRYHGIF